MYRDARGEVLGVFATARDITERKKAEQEIKKAHDLLEKRVNERTAELVQSNAQLKEEISQRRLADSQVKKTVSELYAAIESTADGIYVVDRAGKLSGITRILHPCGRFRPNYCKAEKTIWCQGT